MLHFTCTSVKLELAYVMLLKNMNIREIILCLTEETTNHVSCLGWSLTPNRVVKTSKMHICGRWIPIGKKMPGT